MIREFFDISLRDRNSFGVEQQAAHLIEFDATADLQQFFRHGAPAQWQVLSGGNNTLFTQDYAGTIITPRTSRIDVTDEQGDAVFVRVEAGVEWDDVVEWAVGNDLWGIENLSLIPGKAGAAPVQNIGAYGCEVKDVLSAVECFSVETCNTLILNRDHCSFGYRDSIFKRDLRGRVIITAVTLRLSRTPRPSVGYGDVAREVEARGGATLRNIREAVCAIRRAKLPDCSVMGNAGSFFKNPFVDAETAGRLQAEYPDMPTYPGSRDGEVKLAAGWLIDRCGFRGWREGHVGVHDRQALVLVNTGGATGSEVMALARKIQTAVYERFGVAVDTEVNLL